MSEHYTKIKDLQKGELAPIEGGVAFLTNEFINLLMNAVTIKSKNNSLSYPVERIIKLALIENNAVGYDKLTDTWAYVFGEGLNNYGLPTRLVYRYPNGRTFSRKANYEPKENGSYIIYALPADFSLAQMIRNTCEFMYNCNVAANQNINACKTPYVVVCKDKDLLLSLETALQQKQDGQAAIIVSEDIGEGLKAVNISADFLADKFLALKDYERNKLLNKLGIMSANTEKRERVQVGEVNATLGQCVDYIYLLIDTFNKQMETYELPFKMEINESLEELYNNDFEEEKPEENLEEGGLNNDK